MPRRRLKHYGMPATALAVRAAPPQRLQSRWVAALTAAALSCALHGAAAWTLPRATPTPPRARPVNMDIVRPAPTPAAVPVARPTPAVAAAPNLTTPPRRPSRPQPPHPTAPPAAAVPQTVAPARQSAVPIRIGVALSATTAAGGVAMETGQVDGVAGGAAAGAALSAAGARGPGAPGAEADVPSYELSRAPEVDTEPDLRDFYPDAERLANKEAQVVLQLHIDATGKVRRAEVTHSEGPAFDAAAVRAAMQHLHFRPAQRSGADVATAIAYKMTFLLD